MDENDINDDLREIHIKISDFNFVIFVVYVIFVIYVIFLVLIFFTFVGKS